MILRMKEQTEKSARVMRTIQLKIIKPLNMPWDEFGEILRNTRWRTWRLANMMINDHAMHWQATKDDKLDQYAQLIGWKENGKGKIRPFTVDQMNQKLGEQLRSEGVDCPKGAVNGYITAALHQRMQGLLSGDNWKSYTRGERTLPTMRLSMPIPLRGGKGSFDPIYWSEDHQGFVLEPRLTTKPYPKVLVGLPPKDKAGLQWVQNLVDNPEQSLSGWRQRSFEIYEDKSGSWYVAIAYDRPDRSVVLNPDVVCGVKVAYNSPLTVFCGGDFRGEKEFGWIAKRIRSLRNETDKRRRSIQFGGRKNYGVRSGRGRKRKLGPIEILRGRIDNAQTTYNHVMSRMVVDFALNKEAGTIQMEDLSDLKNVLRSTFLGTNWRYYQLQQMIESKAKDYGIKVVKISPRYTVKRCPSCGWIDEGFDKKTVSKYVCANPKCADFNKPVSPDWNGAMNLSIDGIEKQVRSQLKRQSKKEKHSGKQKVKQKAKQEAKA